MSRLAGKERGQEMVKISFCLRRHPGMTHEEFLRYWEKIHAPLVRQHQVALRIVRYVQLHTELGPLTSRLQAFRDSPEPYDGIAEIWYESREALLGLGDDPAARSASRLLRDDEKHFVDLANSPIFVGAEIGIISSGTP